MPKYQRTFDKALDRLFAKRIDRLKGEVWANKPGPSAELNRRKIDKYIENLQEIIEKALSKKNYHSELKNCGVKKCTWTISGYGTAEKIKRFRKFYKKRIDVRECFYAIYNKEKCIYIGSTEKSGEGRPTNHFDKKWFPSKGLIRVFYGMSKSHVLKLECLAIHVFKPTKNDKTPPKKKWQSKCEICRKQRLLEKEIRDIF